MLASQLWMAARHHGSIKLQVVLYLLPARHTAAAYSLQAGIAL